MATKQVKLPVSGMTCAACAFNVQRALTATSGVSEVYVSRSPAYASIRYDPAQVTLTDLVKQVFREGYGIVQDTSEFTFADTPSAESVHLIQQLITQVQGVLNVEVNQPDRTVQVSYIRGLTDRETIVQGLEVAGYSVLKQPEPVHQSGMARFFKSIFGTERG